VLALSAAELVATDIVRRLAAAIPCIDPGYLGQEQSSSPEAQTATPSLYAGMQLSLCAGMLTLLLLILCMCLLCARAQRKEGSVCSEVSRQACIPGAL
jgi:hypothetical protein